MTIMIETERLYLRTWQPWDIESYWAINQDARVIEFLRGSLTIDEAKQFIIDKNWQQKKRGKTNFRIKFFMSRGSFFIG